MDADELAYVGKHLKSVLSTHHGCALTKEEITPFDELRGIRVGDICDSCSDMMNSILLDIAKKHCKEAIPYINDKVKPSKNKRF